MIARVWHGVTQVSLADEYLEYLKDTGLADFRAVEGNLGVVVLRNVTAERADFQLISFWDSYESIRRFAGDDVEKAVYYPEDEEFLLELEPEVRHYDVIFEAGLSWQTVRDSDDPANLGPIG